MCRLEVRGWSFSIILYLNFWGRLSHWAWTLLNLFNGWPASSRNPLDSLCLSSVAIIGVYQHARLFTWLLGIEVRVAQQTLYWLGHLSSLRNVLSVNKLLVLLLQMGLCSVLIQRHRSLGLTTPIVPLSPVSANTKVPPVSEWANILCWIKRANNFILRFLKSLVKTKLCTK